MVGPRSLDATFCEVLECNLCLSRFVSDNAISGKNNQLAWVFILPCHFVTTNMGAYFVTFLGLQFAIVQTLHTSDSQSTVLESSLCLLYPPRFELLKIHVSSKKQRKVWKRTVSNSFLKSCDTICHGKDGNTSAAKVHESAANDTQLGSTHLCGEVKWASSFKQN